jgi:hypothetical protein
MVQQKVDNGGGFAQVVEMVRFHHRKGIGTGVVQQKHVILR